MTEFEKLARHVRACRISCGTGHAWMVARGFEWDFGHSMEDLLRRADAIDLEEAR